MPSSPAALSLVLVTGPSGAGRSSAIKCLEDVGYEAIDNMPLSLVPRLLDSDDQTGQLALGIDTRNRDFSTAALIDLIDQLNRMDRIELQVLYLDARPDALLRRFSETRRRHPLADLGSPSAAIAQENDLLMPIRDRADVLIETSDLSPHELRAEIVRWFAIDKTRQLMVSLHSFSYKRGLPRGLDLAFDCRFLRNPHWEPDLKPKTGLSADVVSYVMADKLYDPFFNKLVDMLLLLLPAYRDEGKSHLSIGLGCTGGQHRSVAVTENLARALEEGNWPVSIRHREFERRAALAEGALGK